MSFDALYAEPGYLEQAWQLVLLYNSQFLSPEINQAEVMILSIERICSETKIWYHLTTWTNEMTSWVTNICLLNANNRSGMEPTDAFRSFNSTQSDTLKQFRQYSTVIHYCLKPIRWTVFISFFARTIISEPRMFESLHRNNNNNKTMRHTTEQDFTNLVY